MLINADNLVWVGRRIDNRDEAWQMPQGGLDKGEEPWPGALRELEEETGMAPRLVDKIADHPQQLKYDIPDAIAFKLWKGSIRARSRTGIWRASWGRVDVDIAQKHPEFSHWQWVEPKLLPELIVPFKRDMYRAILDGFAEWLCAAATSASPHPALGSGHAGAGTDERDCVEQATATDACAGREVGGDQFGVAQSRRAGASRRGAGGGVFRVPGRDRADRGAPVDAIDARGKSMKSRMARTRLSVRPEAPLQLLLTGHMDTVFGADHPFQHMRWLDKGVLNGPGVADMKGGIAVMLAALKAVEASPLASGIGYEVILNSDEEVGSLGSAELIARAARASAPR